MAGARSRVGGERGDGGGAAAVRTTLRLGMLCERQGLHDIYVRIYVCVYIYFFSNGKARGFDRLLFLFLYSNAGNCKRSIAFCLMRTAGKGIERFQFYIMLMVRIGRDQFPLCLTFCEQREEKGEGEAIAFCFNHTNVKKRVKRMENRSLLV